MIRYETVIGREGAYEKYGTQFTLVAIFVVEYLLSSYGVVCFY